MKQLLSLLLAFIMVLPLSACRKSPEPAVSSEPESSSESESTSAETIPSEYIKEQLLIYWEITTCLERYIRENRTQFTPSGMFINLPSGHDGLVEAHRILKEMEFLDPYLTEENWYQYVSGYRPESFDRKSYLSRFTVIEDVLLEMDRTKFNSEYDPDTFNNYIIWHYNLDGSLQHIEQVTYSSGTWSFPGQEHYRRISSQDRFFEYDEAGKIINNCFGSTIGMSIKLSPAYDDLGRLICERDPIKCAVYYRYNDDGLLSRMEYERPFITHSDGTVTMAHEHWTYAYTLNENGFIAQSVEKFYNADEKFPQEVTTTNYTYDDYGNIIRKEISKESWSNCSSSPILGNTYHYLQLFTYDAQHRLLTRTIDNDALVDAESGMYTLGSSYIEETYIYGDKYIFDEHKVNLKQIR